MFLDKPLPQNKTFELKYSSATGTPGVTLIVVGWVPKDGNAVPHSRDLVVAPSATRALKGTIPSDAAARRIEIRVDVPDAGAKGVLVLTVDDEPHTELEITRDVSLTGMVIA